MAAVTGGTEGAYFVPAVDFAIGVSLNACSLPAIRRRMPQEIAFRADIAAYVASRAAKIGAESGLFVRAYRANPYLSKLLGSHYIEELSDEYQMRSLCEPPFLDAAIAIGGALRALHKSGAYGEQAASAIIDSPNLRLIAQVQGPNMKQVQHRLGIPYAREHHYVTGSQDESPTVAFHPRTIAFLRKYIDKESGCPALKVRPNQGRSVFSDRWLAISRFLLAEGAEASANLPSHIKRRLAPATV